MNHLSKVQSNFEFVMGECYHCKTTTGINVIFAALVLEKEPTSLRGLSNTATLTGDDVSLPAGKGH